MKSIKKGIVISNDIERILNGINAFDYKYDFIPSSSLIKSIREDFSSSISSMFDNYTIISEDEMLEINRFIGGEYPHCYIG